MQGQFSYQLLWPFEVFYAMGLNALLCFEHPVQGLFCTSSGLAFLRRFILMRVFGCTAVMLGVPFAGLTVYHPWQTFNVLITAWVTCSTIVLGTSCAGSALLAVYWQWCSLSCGFLWGSVTCVCRGGYLLPGLIGFCVLFLSSGGCHMA